MKGRQVEYNDKRYAAIKRAAEQVHRGERIDSHALSLIAYGAESLEGNGISILMKSEYLSMINAVKRINDEFPCGTDLRTELGREMVKKELPDEYDFLNSYIIDEGSVFQKAHYASKKPNGRAA